MQLQVLWRQFFFEILNGILIFQRIFMTGSVISSVLPAPSLMEITPASTSQPGSRIFKISGASRPL